MKNNKIFLSPIKHSKNYRLFKMQPLLDFYQRNINIDKLQELNTS